MFVFLCNILSHIFRRKYNLMTSVDVKIKRFMIYSCGIRMVPFWH